MNIRLAERIGDEVRVILVIRRHFQRSVDTAAGPPRQPDAGGPATRKHGHFRRLLPPSFLLDQAQTRLSLPGDNWGRGGHNSAITGHARDPSDLFAKVNRGCEQPDMPKLLRTGQSVRASRSYFREPRSDHKALPMAEIIRLPHPSRPTVNPHPRPLFYPRGCVFRQTASSAVSSTAVYRCVVDRLACPSRSWIDRKSLPLASRCVAKECRSA